MTEEVEAVLSLESILASFAAARERVVGPRLEEFLPPGNDPLYEPALQALVRLDLEWSWSRGIPVRLESYRGRFPRLFANAGILKELACAEYHHRLQAGEGPHPQEYHQRFGLDVADWPAPTILPRASANPDATRPTGSKGPGMPAEVAQGLAELLAQPQALARWDEAMTRMPRVGEEFLGFVLVHELGQGAFGRVFLARQPALADRPVALKVSADLRGETQQLAQLQHTNIVPIYSAHRAGHLQAICMPYFGCTTLADLCRALRPDTPLPTSGQYVVATLRQRQSTLADDSSSGWPGLAVGRASQPDVGLGSPTYGERQEPRPPVSPSQPRALVNAAPLASLEKMPYVDVVLLLGARLADGLAHAHERGIIHRDLKPANVLLTEDGQPMLLDFNLAEDTKQRTAASVARAGGTLPYMAPEQLEAFRGVAHPLDHTSPERQRRDHPCPVAGAPGLCLDGRGDVYGLGLILYQLLTGRLPYPTHHGSLEEVLPRMLADRQKSPPSPQAINRAVSPAVASIVQHCLAADPARRYPSARALKEDIERHLAHLPLKHAPEPSPRERLAKWARRHPRLASPATVLLLLAVLLLLTASVAVHRSLKWRERELDGQREAAIARYADFEDRFHQAETLLGQDDQEQVLRGAQTGQEALAVYQILDRTDWADQPAVTHLPPQDRERLRHEVGELAFLLARAVHFRPVGTGLTPVPSTLARRASEGQRRTPSLARRASVDGTGVSPVPTILNQLAEDCLGPEAGPVVALQRLDLPGAAVDATAWARLRERLRNSGTSTGRPGFLLACAHTARGRYLEALPLLADLVRVDPRDFSSWYLKGCCHQALSEPTDALAAFSTCIALRPTFARTYVLRAAVALVHHKDARQALADLDQALRLDPTLVAAHVDRALALNALGRCKEALAELDHALDRPGVPSRTWFIRAQVRAQVGDQDGAHRDHAEGLKLEPTDAVSWIARGVARVRVEPRAALDDFKRAEQLNPRSVDALINQAYVWAEVLGQNAEGLRVLDRLQQTHPDDVNGRCGRAVLLARLGRTAEAVAEARRCLAISPRPENLYRAACICALAGKGDPRYLPESKQLLAAALLQGWGHDHVPSDTDLDPLRGDRDFRLLLQSVEVLQSWKKKKK